ncbi:MAG TPA: EAL domain-containing protein [Candidatus Atribacteria bacterium]|nr:EAL domain-containing protein [Candidatus Atribacteria bacterium]
MLLKILLVADSTSDCLLIKDKLTGYIVVIATDRHEALGLIEKHKDIDLVLVDLDMPEMEGFRLLEHLSSVEQYKGLRTIIMTGQDEPENELRGLELGAIDYIRKPIHTESLLARIKVHADFFRLKRALEQKLQEQSQALQESERRKSVVLSHLPGLAYRCSYDRDWTVQYASSGCLKLTGYPSESLLYNRDLSFNDLIAPEYREDIWNEWLRVLPKRQTFKYEYEIITAGGQRKWVLELGEGIFNSKGEVEAVEGIVIDITDRKAIEEALKYSNEHDSLTGLHNQSYLVNLLNNDSRDKNSGNRAVVGINLSKIQSLTVTYGFNYTQNLIKKLVAALADHCTDTRRLFSTYGNQFVFYIKGYRDRNELISFCEAVSNTLSSLLTIERIDGGIGIVEIDPEEGQDAVLILKNLLIAAEKALQRNDREFGYCFYDKDIEAEVRRKNDIISELTAVVTDEGSRSFYLVYQPILDLKSRRICGFEALARLKSDKLGHIPPSEFIPIAEEEKLIIPIGNKVIMYAFRFLNKLKEYGYKDIYVSINLSVVQLFKNDFVDSLFDMIKKMQVTPENIVFEITESVFCSDFDEINRILGRLRSAGITIAIDDFGTGYSSLSRERELNVDYIKIDKSFIDKILMLGPHRAITGDIVSMAHKLNHYAIAEGVEHEKQMEYLQGCGCDKIQGYFISKPLDEEKAIELLGQAKSRQTE